jgi:serine phosphatase RsbU (regulator of sigma subunit)
VRNVTALVSSTSTSVRTLILGIDPAGRIVWHDRNAREMLDPPDGALMGAALGDLVMGSAAGTVSGLLDAGRSGREATAVLTFRAQRSGPVDAVVTVHAIDGYDGGSALAIVRMPTPSMERFLDPAVMRHALLDDTFRHIGATLDLDQMARGLINLVVAHFSDVASLLVQESLVADEAPMQHEDGPHLLRRLAVASYDHDPGWEVTFPIGEVVRHPAGTIYAQCMDTGKPVQRASGGPAGHVAESWMRRPAAGLLSGACKLLLPLNARGATLGYIVCTRTRGSRPFDAYDTEIGMEFASRAAILLDNARRYNRERMTALTLQRSLLPTDLSAPSSVEVRHRYLPGSQLIEVGGDWYESIALPGARVALVVGDVAGHGVRAAVTMGRLRTAIQTLAMLELPPAESLEQLNELMRQMGEREPHFATCAYAIYDAVTRTLEVASAGHLPPLLVSPQGSSEFLDVSPAPPLGVGEGPISSRTFEIKDGSLFVLYTDGLVESRGRDIDDGLKQLQSVFGPTSVAEPIEALAKAALAGVSSDRHRDDVALLIARLAGIGGDRQACWSLSGDLTSAREARRLVIKPLEKWQLGTFVPITQLLASELVTNAIRYAGGPVTLRLICEDTLVCEVADSSPALPRLWDPAGDDERGRGLQIVSRLSHRWGSRRTPTGKVVWCEQHIPRPKPEGRLSRVPWNFNGGSGNHQANI